MDWLKLSNKPNAIFHRFCADECTRLKLSNCKREWCAAWCDRSQARSHLRSFSGFWRHTLLHPAFLRRWWHTRMGGTKTSVRVPRMAASRIDSLDTQEIALVILGTRDDPSGIRSACLLRVLPAPFSINRQTGLCPAMFLAHLVHL